MLERRGEVVEHMRAAEEELRLASEAATETHDGREGLQGETALMLGGFSQAVGAVADMVEMAAKSEPVAEDDAPAKLKCDQCRCDCYYCKGGHNSGASTCVFGH